MENSPNKKTILLLEDDMLLLRAIKDKLEREGYETLLARTFDQAEQYLIKEEVTIDLIWLDHYLLGGKTGLDFLTRVRSDDKRSDTPVFVVSNSTNEETIAKYRALKMCKYYLKANFRLEEIVVDIKRFLG